MPGVYISYQGKHRWIRLPDGVHGAGVGIHLERNWSPVIWYFRKQTEKRRPRATVQKITSENNHSGK